jgi:alkylhydroperoxidase family enzyme
MSSEAATTDALARVLVDQPDVHGDLTAAHGAAVEAIGPRLHDLCRLRIATLLGTPDEHSSEVLDPDTIAALPQWPSHPTFSSSERACLALTEQFVIDVESISDEMADSVVRELGADGFATLVNALVVIEQRQRLRLIWGRLFEEQPQQ